MNAARSPGAPPRSTESTEPNNPIGILRKARMPGPRMYPEPLGGHEPAAQIALVRGAVSAQSNESRVDELPVDHRLRRIVVLAGGVWRPRAVTRTLRVWSRALPRLLLTQEQPSRRLTMRVPKVNWRIHECVRSTQYFRLAQCLTNARSRPRTAFFPTVRIRTARLDAHRGGSQAILRLSRIRAQVATQICQIKSTRMVHLSEWSSARNQLGSDRESAPR